MSFKLSLLPSELLYKSFVRTFLILEIFQINSKLIRVLFTSLRTTQDIIQKPN
jgi:hypothetical protein